MSKCQWNDCTNEATTVVSRNATEDEIKRSKLITKEGVTWVGVVETSVCDQHLEEAQREYPSIVNEEP